ncbi:MAG: hypothetical protein K1563_20570, partial [Candidatus Thiodiazotropha sp. (ex. Lucinisca nassula)]|nr:hypothetical protein [Candidatus Thiodiazotropha sp. (ex. Lucinisca nassula)]
MFSWYHKLVSSGPEGSALGVRLDWRFFRGNRDWLQYLSSLFFTHFKPMPVGLSPRQQFVAGNQRSINDNTG